jgi:pyruvate/2-oxoglutarate dehydrogenase complex dihydrolipoamide dehydrogenase (E3) component
MSEPEQFEVLILGSGEAGKLLAWHMAGSGRRTAVVERRWIGGSCPNIACLPSKNEIWSARVAHLTKHAAQFGTMIAGAVTTDMAKVRQRKRNMVEGEIAFHLHNYQTTGSELIMGAGRFVAPKTLEVQLNDGGTRVLAADQVFLNVGTHAAIPSVPASRLPGRSPTSRLSSWIICRHIWPCSAAAMSGLKWPRLTAGSAAA